MACGKCGCGEQMVAITNGTVTRWRCKACKRTAFCESAKIPEDCPNCHGDVESTTARVPDGCICDGCGKYLPD